MVLSKQLLGTETEFGIASRTPGVDAYAKAVQLSTAAVQAAGASFPGQKTVPWDYQGEDPLADLRGGRLPRAAAAPSQLTDQGATVDGVDVQGRGCSDCEQTVVLTQAQPQPLRMQPANIVTPAGARIYVDHAHPEYSAPETRGPLAAARYERAGELIAQRAMAIAPDLVFYKNNVDGKGASWGTHENYLFQREIPFELIKKAFTTFFVFRPLLCGAGRVGLGQRGSESGFQISQRADYIENDVGLETTFNRPIINTRDEPHAPRAYRRFHVIGGDANRFDYSAFLRLASTGLLVWLVETGTDAAVAQLPQLLGDPVPQVHTASRDLTFTALYPTTQGELSALEILARYREIISAAVSRDEQAQADAQTQEALRLWGEALADLCAFAQREADPQLDSALAQLPEGDVNRGARRLEWVAKYQLFTRLRERNGCDWLDPRMLAADLRWAELTPGKSLVDLLDRSGAVEHLFSESELAEAATQPPADTRAYARGKLVANFAQTTAASWTSVSLVTSNNQILRVALSDPQRDYAEILEQVEEQL